MTRPELPPRPRETPTPSARGLILALAFALVAWGACIWALYLAFKP